MYDFYKVQKAICLLPDSKVVEFRQYPTFLKIISDLPNCHVDIYANGDPRAFGKVIRTLNINISPMLISDLRLENIIGHGTRVRQGDHQQHGLIVWAFEKIDE